MRRWFMLLVCAFLLLTMLVPFQATAADSGSAVVAENSMVDPSATLIPVDSVEGTIVDFDDTRTLYYDTDYKLRIKNRTDGTETIIYNPPNYGLGMSLLTPAGALVRAFCGKDCAKYFLWNSGQLKDTGIWASTDFFAQTNGKYAFSGYTGDLIDTETGETRNFGRVGNIALAADGSFVAANNEGITLFQPDGTSRQLIKTSLEYPSLVSDGKTVLLNTNQRDILKYADGSLTEISKSISDDDITSPHSDFEINQGWIAYTKPTPSGRRQIFLESPQGTVTQVTYFNGNPKIRALNEHGTLAITYNSDLYMYHPGDQEPKKLISDSTNISYHNGAWYQAVEGTLFRLNDAPGDTTAPQWPAAGEIKVDIYVDDFNKPQHTKLALSVNVQSKYEIQKVTAKVDDREVDLELADCGAGCTWWNADFPLDGLQQGVKSVTVTAFDYAGRTSKMTKNFLYDAPPEVQITGVSKHHVVQNRKFRALVSTKDELSIPVIRVSLSTADRVIETFEAKGSLDHEFDLTAYKDQIVTYRVQVFDGENVYYRNLRFSSEYHLYVDPSSTLIPVDSVEGTIVDFDDNRTLYYDTDYKIKNRTDGTEIIIYNPPNYGLGKSLLTPTGAMMRAFCGKDCARYFLWNSGQLKDTGIWASTDFFAQTNGKYAFSYYTGDLIDTETGKTRNFGRVGNVALAANGSFVAANNEGITLFQPDGTSRQLIKTSLEYPSLVSDGKTVLLNINSRDILKYADGSLTEISKSAYYDDITSPHSDFEINQGWIAYTKPTPSGRRQIFLESPQGTVTQVTYFNGNPKIRALNEHGTLAITYNSDLYMYHPGDQEPKKLISDSTNISYHNGAWYQAVEGTLFRLNDAPGDTTAPQWPVGDVLTVTDVTYNSVQLNWQPATDETGVDKYLLYQDNTLLDTLNGDVSSYEVKGLSPKSSYLFSLVAVDAAGNQSVKQEVTFTTAAYATPFQLSDSKTYSYGGSNYEFLLYYGYISSSGQELSGSWSPPEGFHGVVKVSMASPYGEDYDLSLETVGEGNRLPEDTTLLTNGTEYSATEVPGGYRAEWRVKGHTGNDYSRDKKVFVYVSIKYDNH